MKLSEKQQIFTQNIACLIQFAYSQGFKLTFGHAWRSPEEQRRLVSEGKSQTLESNHLNRLAIDFNLFEDGELTWSWEKYKILGDYWESLNPKNRWGVDWNKNDKKDGFIDSPHFEMHL